MPAFIPDRSAKSADRCRPRKTAADIRCTFKRHTLRLQEAAPTDSCRRLCALWHNEFGACLTLDTQRLRALLNRLGDYSVEQLGWAILAYRAECDTYRGEWAGRHKQFVNWLYDDRLEEYVTRGEALAAKQKTAAPRRASALADERRAIDCAALFKSWQQLPSNDRRTVLDQAVKELELRAPIVGAKDERNPLVRSKICQLMQRKEVETQTKAAPIAAAIEEAMS